MERNHTIQVYYRQKTKMKKKIEQPRLLCWDCRYARTNEDARYKTPSGEYIFKNCYLNPNDIKRGIMDNTLACINYKRKTI